MLRVYHCLLPEKEPALPAELISAYRKDKLKKQTNALLRLHSAAAELLLRYALHDSGYRVDGPLDIAVGRYGKPFLWNGACFFSLSHSARAILCALCDLEIGADIQIQSKAQDALLQRCLREDERSFVCGATDPNAAFTEIWAKKESFCKLDGRGLALSLGSFSVFDEAIAPLLAHKTAGEYHLAVSSEAVKTEQAEWIEVKTSVLFP